MKSDLAIQVEDVGKSYLIGHKRDHTSSNYRALRDELISAPLRYAKHTLDAIRGKQLISGDDVEEFWALRGVSFDVREGERVGIIGRNGAGKSTLLKVLSRITDPTTGRVTLKGRIASLLEVGTGFHMELSGRENIYVNGSILGMSRRDIQKRFDEIVEFASVEKFIDTPVKRYSSGMYLRLAFSVAAHLEPDILIVDEVLAVGDADFQKKCLGRMQSAGREGRTVLFVSHNMEAVSEICSRAILLRDGELKTQGPTSEVIETYLASRHSDDAVETYESNCGRFRLKRPFWINEAGSMVDGFRFGAPIKLRFEFDFQDPVPTINPGIRVVDMTGRTVFISHLADTEGFRAPDNYYGRVVLDTVFNLPQLAPGHYEVFFGVRDESEQTVVYAEHDLFLEITPPDSRKNGAGGVLWHTTSWSLNR